MEPFSPNLSPLKAVIYGDKQNDRRRILRGRIHGRRTELPSRPGRLPESSRGVLLVIPGSDGRGNQREVPAVSRGTAQLSPDGSADVTSEDNLYSSSGDCRRLQLFAVREFVDAKPEELITPNPANASVDDWKALVTEASRLKPDQFHLNLTGGVGSP